MKHSSNSAAAFQYKRDVLISLAIVLAMMISLVHLWPDPGPAEPSIVYSDLADDPIQIDEIPSSRQPQAPPPPPAMPPPIAVPDVVDLEELELDLASELSDEWFADTNPPDPDGHFSSAPEPDIAARQLRLVEPRYSQAAQQEGIRAQITVEVLVDEDGQVAEATIQQIILLDDTNQPSDTVGQLGYGLEESALDAARRTTFVPAQSGGSTVPSRTTITIRFGV